MCRTLEELFPITPTGDSQLAGIMRVRGGIPKATFYPTREQLFRDLYHSSVSPYTDLPDNEPDAFEGKYESFAQRNKENIHRLVRQALGGQEPRLILEVGSFVGSGAIFTWAPLVGTNGIVLCADTWLGDLNMRLGPQFQQFMNIKDGFPKLGLNFMKRVKAHGLQNNVLPLPFPSIGAARFLHLLGYKFDVIYLDSAHERGETMVELQLMWQLLRPGGVLLGDDYDFFPAVGRDVRAFARCHNLKIINAGKEQWLLVKDI